MIMMLRPSKQVAWLLDELKEVLDRIKVRLSRETHPQRAVPYSSTLDSRISQKSMNFCRAGVINLSL